jgi:hypothetical protein
MKPNSSKPTLQIVVENSIAILRTEPSRTFGHRNQHTKIMRWTISCGFRGYIPSDKTSKNVTEEK